MSDFFEFPQEPSGAPSSIKKPPSGGKIINTKSMEFLEGDNAGFDYDREKKRFLDHMKFLSEQNVEEHTLYKKWIELITNYSSTADIIKAAEVEVKIWKPTDIFNKEQTIQEIQNLVPEVVIVPDVGMLSDDWKYLRAYAASFEHIQGVGRAIRILIRDRATQKYLGFCSINSDVAVIKCRDEWIGWTKQDKFDRNMLNHIAIGTTIMPTQPFGYNFLGGKLVASLLCTKTIRDEWKEKFGDTLVGMTTTSLYGGHSMYQRIPFWKEIGYTTGKTPIKPDDSYYNVWLNWIKLHRTEEFERATMARVGTIKCADSVCHVDSPYITLRGTKEDITNLLYKQNYSVHSNGVIYDPKSRHSYPTTGPKRLCMQIIMRELGISASTLVHGYKRGVYFAPFYENTREFLRGEIQHSQLIPNKKLDRDVDSVLDWWKTKAISRYTKLYEENRILPDILYYRKAVQMSWDEVKETYLRDVGR